MRSLVVLVLVGGVASAALAEQVKTRPAIDAVRQQDEREADASQTQRENEAAIDGLATNSRPETLVIPAGTRVPVALKHAISTKSARPGDSVYAQTTFPIAYENQLLIPAGTYVQGVISRITRPGRVKGRAEILFHFTSLVFPNGYTVSLPGSVEGLPGADRQRIKDQEGTIQQEGERGKDAATVAKTGATGAVIGAAASRGVKGAAVGGGLGAATGLGIAMLTRGSDIRLEPGTTIEMVIGRAVALDENRVGRSRLRGLPY